MKLYRIDFKMCGTAYIVADNPDRAKVLFDEKFSDGKSYFHNEDGDLVVGTDFETLLEQGESATMSPAVSMYGPWNQFEKPEEVEL